ncbi:MAG: hypothetical protein ACTSRA_18920, partial [Promethearchaeota archaeon]
MKVDGFLIDDLIDREKMEEKDVIFFSKEIFVQIYNADDDSIEIGKVYTMYGGEIEDRLQFFLQPDARAGNFSTTSSKMQGLYKILFNRVKNKDFIFNKLLFFNNTVLMFEHVQLLRET